MTFFHYSFIAFALLTTSCSGKSEPSDQGRDPNQPVVVKSDISFWLSDPTQSIFFAKQNKTLNFGSTGQQPTSIVVDDAQTFQTMDGFGFCLTGGSAMHIYRMEKTARDALLKELFKTDENNIGVSYLRVSIGASDLDDHVFSYDDLPAGDTDPEMKKFSLDPDRQYLIPVLKEILTVNPDIKILGSPWSPPVWMKTNNNSKGGSLLPRWYDAYANYFVKYLQEMKKEGITISAVTVQNEPLHPGNNPSLLMQPEEQALFIKQSLGPAFKAADIHTKIIIYDHNADRPDYPITVLNDPDAAKYVDGSAFHLYAGKISDISQVHEQFPDKNLYFTEQWVGAPGNLPEDLKWHTRELIIGATRNWCRTVLEWNLAANSALQPHTEDGCTECLGALTIDGNNVTRNPAYYIIAHASKSVRPGSVRIASNTSDNLPNVAFKTPDGKKVLIVLNNSEIIQAFNIQYQGKVVSVSLNRGAVGTFVWN